MGGAVKKRTLHVLYLVCRTIPQFLRWLLSLRLSSLRSLIECHVEFQHIDLRRTEESEQGTFGCLANYLLHLRKVHAARLSYSLCLYFCTSGRNVRVKTRTARCDHLGRYFAALQVGMVYEEGINARLYFGQVFGVRSSLIATARLVGFVTVARTRGTTPKVTVRGKGLAHIGSTDHTAVEFYDLSIACVGADQLGHSPQHEYVTEREEDAKDERQAESIEETFHIRLRIRSWLEEETHYEVNEFDTDEGNQDAAQAVNQQVATKQCTGTDGLVFHAAQSQRDEGRNNQRIEDNG